MPESKFTKIGHSDDRMFGPPRLLVCGYPIDDQSRFLGMIEAMDIEIPPIIFIPTEDKNKTILELLELSDRMGQGAPSDMHRAVIFSGCTERQLHRIMENYRNRQLPKQLCATVTPISINWTLNALLEELIKEREAFARKGK